MARTIPKPDPPEWSDPPETETIAEITNLGKTTEDGICLCCGQPLDAESRALRAEKLLREFEARLLSVTEYIRTGQILQGQI